MEHQLWKAILILLKQASKRRRCTRERYGADDIVRVWPWAVLHGRPVSWACDFGTGRCMSVAANCHRRAPCRDDCGVPRSSKCCKRSNVLNWLLVGTSPCIG